VVDGLFVVVNPVVEIQLMQTGNLVPMKALHNNVMKLTFLDFREIIVRNIHVIGVVVGPVVFLTKGFLDHHTLLLK